MSYRRTSLLSLLLLTGSSALHAQTTTTSTGALRVTVRDAAGHVLAGAHGNLYGPRIFGRSMETAADGSLSVPDLAFGNYVLVISQPDFATQRYSFTINAQGAADA